MSYRRVIVTTLDDMHVMPFLLMVVQIISVLVGVVQIQMQENQMRWIILILVYQSIKVQGEKQDSLDDVLDLVKDIAQQVEALKTHKSILKDNILQNN
ncbi:hypothetical protein [Cerasibacillus terrae]|uniref:hypothetical protein n=1 Tax=Cerasibacillus terrae TaxID=2498845 RepID=UPI001746847E|nr:hypothetical protein [Cerasibacillus terrae]